MDGQTTQTVYGALGDYPHKYLTLSQLELSQF